ncbi:MAG: hypothetical protein ATN35_13130 [Epulopiscium sp. Nele67-Bin004]|nr:MAG: hypothetical protein ATN35_13130 [Epulopiscium sp. Nele67-Bin004]
MKVVTNKIYIKKEEITEITLTNDNKMSVTALNLGGIITKIIVPDCNGNFENIALEYDNYSNYIKDPAYMGAIIGRTSGRIHNAKFEIDGETYNLAQNNNDNNLHGGEFGFTSKVWDVTTFEYSDKVVIVFEYTSLDGEEGYGGTVTIKITYTLTNDNALKISYNGTTDKTTLLNLTNHTYFNLSGEYKSDVLGNTLIIDADTIAEVDAQAIPTGNIIQVNDVPALDFTTNKLIGRHISNEYLWTARGYDHPYILNKKEDFDVVCSDIISGRVMTMKTNYDAVIVYSANFPTYHNLKGGVEFNPRYGICFEAQNLPIGYNECNKERSLLRPNEKYDYWVEYKFYTISIDS